MASLSDLKRLQRQKSADEGGPINAGSLDDPTSDLEIFAKEVLTALISDNLPPTPNNSLLLAFHGFRQGFYPQSSPNICQYPR